MLAAHSTMEAGAGRTPLFELRRLTIRTVAVAVPDQSVRGCSYRFAIGAKAQNNCAAGFPLGLHVYE